MAASNSVPPFEHMDIVNRALRVMNMVVKLDTPQRIATARQALIDEIGPHQSTASANRKVNRYMRSMGMEPNNFSVPDPNFNP